MNELQTAFADRSRRQTTSERTAQYYARRVAGLWKRFGTERPESASGVRRYPEFVNWLESRKSTFARPTLIQIRAALKFTLAGDPHPAAKLALNSLEELRTDGCSEDSDRNVAKCLRPEEVNRLEQYLLGIHSPWGVRSWNFLIAVLLTGVRPAEWEHAAYRPPRGLSDGKTQKAILIIENAKHSNGRAGAPTRELELDEIAWDAVYSHITALNEYRDQQGRFAQYKDSCSKTISTASRILWPRRHVRPALYSARHQFVANAKLEGLAAYELAGILGHSSPYTARHYYGRKAAGRKGLLHIRLLSPAPRPINDATLQIKPASNPFTRKIGPE